MVKDESNLNIGANLKLDEAQTKKRVENIKARVSNILDGLVEACTKSQVDSTILNFIGRLTTNNEFPP